ncbi:MAG: DNA mismatch repair endonuclease MutL [Phycisphaerales bacterium]
MSTEALADQRILILPTLVANQIAAGEVVERPASVVKETVENAIDAGATRITVEIEQGGIELIRVTDDGGGILPDDLPLALAPHATSKIRTAEDLEHVETLGFRGEALASISSVARVSIRSRHTSESAASVIEAAGDEISAVRPDAGSVGTVLTVRNLFFNTPARRKFLRTPTTEQGRCAEIVEDLAMAHPAIGFTFITDGRKTIDLPPGQTLRQRVIDVLGKELEPELLEAQADTFDDSRGIALWGLVGTPAIARANRNKQRVFVRGRSVRDKTIQHALSEAYRGLIEPSRHPTAVLVLDMAASAVDVNVHPAKSEVRFRDSSLVHSVVLRAVREALCRADLTPSVFSIRPQLGGVGRSGMNGGATGGPNGLPGSSGSNGGYDSTSAYAPPSPRAFADFVQRWTPRPTTNDGFSSRGSTPSVDSIREAIRGTDAPATGASSDSSHAPYTTDTTHDAPTDTHAIPQPTPAERVLQVHKSYLVTEDEQGVVIIDQHALHERVMFEYLCARVLGDGAGAENDAAVPTPLESQRLLMPEVVEVSRSIASGGLDQLTPILTRLGIEASVLGPTTLGVSAFPTFLFDRNVDAQDFLKEFFDKAEQLGLSDSGKNAGEEALREVLDMMACKAAVKAGDRLTPTELIELVKLRGAVERSSNCPHGRPTSIRLTIRDLEKLFGRS